MVVGFHDVSICILDVAIDDIVPIDFYRDLAFGCIVLGGGRALLPRRPKADKGFASVNWRLLRKQIEIVLVIVVNGKEVHLLEVAADVGLARLRALMVSFFVLAGKLAESALYLSCFLGYDNLLVPRELPFLVLLLDIALIDLRPLRSGVFY